MASLARTPEARAFWRERRAAHPGLREALVADALMALRHRGEGEAFRSRLDVAWQVARLALVSDGFLGQALYRVKAWLQARGVPVVPAIVHRLAMIVAQVAIGDPVTIAAGVYIAHGQVVLDGITEIAEGCVIAPFVTIGLTAGNLKGPTIERDVMVGAGASILGPVRIGAGATIGTGAVVLKDVPAGATVGGVPARSLED
jgi:serine O-acetyltransferase